MCVWGCGGGGGGGGGGGRREHEQIISLLPVVVLHYTVFSAVYHSVWSFLVR